MTLPGQEPKDLRQRLRGALVDRLRARDADTVAALRATLAAIDNAEAVEPPETESATADHHFAGSTSGLAAAEAERRELTPAEIEQIVTQEIDERRAAAGQFDRAGRPDQGHRLRAEANLLASLLSA